MKRIVSFIMALATSLPCIIPAALLRGNTSNNKSQSPTR